MKRLKGSNFIKNHLSENLHQGHQYSLNNVNPFILEALNDCIVKLKTCSNSKILVVEFGARAGALGRRLLSQPFNQYPLTYIGIEPYPPKNCYNIVTGSCEDINVNKSIVKDIIKRASIVVYADVLEHLYDPWSHLQRVRLLNTSSQLHILASIPNFFHHENISELSHLKFTYESWGVMDFTHLRFFGKEDVLSLFNLAGFKVDSKDIKYACDPKGLELYNSFKLAGLLNVGSGPLSLRITSEQEALHCASYQFILTAIPE